MKISRVDFCLFAFFLERRIKGARDYSIKRQKKQKKCIDLNGELENRFNSISRILLYLFVSSARSLVYPMDMRFALFDSYVWSCVFFSCGYRLSRNEFRWFCFLDLSLLTPLYLVCFCFFSSFYFFLCVLIWFVRFFTVFVVSLLLHRLRWTFHKSLTHTLSLLILFYIHSFRGRLSNRKKSNRQPKNWLIELPRNRNPIQSEWQVFV